MSSASYITAEVQEFIQSCIPSALHVDVLLLLSENPAVTWSASEVSDRLRSNSSFVSLILAEFQSYGMLVPADGTDADAGAEMRYRYQPNSGDLAQKVDGLARAYRERRHSVLAAIYNPPEPDPLQAFSDAFSFFRKKPPEEQ